MSTLIVPQSVPSPTEDSEQLRKAFSGWGTNEGLIISILAHRNADQRKLIRQTYVETHGEDLLKALDKELSNDFENLLTSFPQNLMKFVAERIEEQSHLSMFSKL